MVVKNKKYKVVTVVGTRPEIIRLSRVLPLLDKNFKHTIVHTGQNYAYELNEIFFKDLGLRRPDIFLNSATSKNSLAKTISNIIYNIDNVFKSIGPDALLILGDTNSSLAALSAKRRKIPIFHMEAGNRCFDQRVPEEINRKIIDHLADINLTYSSLAREYLLKEGIPSDRIIKTGSPMQEVINYYLSKIHKSKILSKLKLDKEKYFVVSTHREENIDSEKNFEKIKSIINMLAEDYKIPVVISTHPRTKKKLEIKKSKFHSKVNFIKPLGFCDYIKLQIFSKVVLSDSGTITEESSILNFPALNIRETHERPEGMEEASVMMVGLDQSRIKNAISILQSQLRGDKRTLSLVSDYNVDNVSHKIIRIINSYVDYINREIWKK